MPKKKSKNQLRVRRLKLEMDELNYLNRVISETVSPLRERRNTVVESIREKLLDEGISPDAIQVKVDDVSLEIEWEIAPPAAAPPPAPPAKKPAPKKPTRSRK